MRKMLTLCAAAMIAISTMATEGALSGVFSVSDTKQVQFSQGNLQYQASSKTWRFAEHQWEYVGGSSTGVVYENEDRCNNHLISDTYTGWIDLFGWGTGNAPTKWAEDDNEYSTFTDWGVNAISNGGNAANLWRTLTADEWNYLIRERTNADSLFTYATVNGKVGIEDVYIEGVLLLPDNWVTPDGLTVKRLLAEGNDVSWSTEGKSYTINMTNPFSINSYSDSQWQQLEAAGAVFLPKTFYRYVKAVADSYISGRYWSSTQTAEYWLGQNAYELGFEEDMLRPENSTPLHFGGAVRLVQDYEVTPNVFIDGILPGKFSVSADRKIQFAQGNLQYQCADKEWKFAEAQYEFIGADNTNIAEDYDGYIDLFGWGTSGYNGRNPWLNTNNDLDYGNPDNDTKSNIAGTDYDWGVHNAISNGGNAANLWRTLTAAEWKYIFAQRENAANLRSKATVVGKEGLILLPDDWNLTAKPLAATLSNFTDVTISERDWIIWEAAGAVFLPTAGTRYPNLGSYSANSFTYATGTYSDYYGDDYRMCSIFDLTYATTADGIGSADYMIGSAVRLAKSVALRKVTINTEHCNVTVEPSAINLDAVEEGTTLTLTAVPESGYKFDHWTNTDNLTESVTTLNVVNDITVTATCVEKIYKVTIADNPDIIVTGWKDNNGNDVDSTAVPATLEYIDILITCAEGMNVESVDGVDVGDLIDSDNSHIRLKVSRDINLEITTMPIFYSVHLSAAELPSSSPAPQREGARRAPMAFAGGHVIAYNAGTTDEPSDLDLIPHGTKLDIVASAETGWTFAQWSNTASTATTQEVTITSDTTIIAYFQEEASSAINDVQDNVQCTKILRDGVLLIERNGKTYNAQGAQVR